MAALPTFERFIVRVSEQISVQPNLRRNNETRAPPSVYTRRGEDEACLPKSANPIIKFMRHNLYFDVVGLPSNHPAAERELYQMYDYLWSDEVPSFVHTCVVMYYDFQFSVGRIASNLKVPRCFVAFALRWFRRRCRVKFNYLTK